MNLKLVWPHVQWKNNCTYQRIQLVNSVYNSNEIFVVNHSFDDRYSYECLASHDK